MLQDIVDGELAEAELAASPELFGQRDSQEIELVLTESTPSSSISTSRQVPENFNMLNRLSTQTNLHYHPTKLSRIATQRSQHHANVGISRNSRTSSRAPRPLPAFGAGKTYPPLASGNDYIVEFDGLDDALPSQKWPLRKKLINTAVLGFITITASFASSIFSAAI